MILKSRIKVTYAENLYNTLKREYLVIIYPFIMEVFILSAMVVYGELIRKLDFFCSGVQLYVLLSPYLCLIFFIF